MGPHPTGRAYLGSGARRHDDQWELVTLLACSPGRLGRGTGFSRWRATAPVALASSDGPPVFAGDAPRLLRPTRGGGTPTAPVGTPTELAAGASAACLTLSAGLAGLRAGLASWALSVPARGRPASTGGLWEHRCPQRARPHPRQARRRRLSCSISSSSSRMRMRSETSGAEAAAPAET